MEGNIKNTKFINDHNHNVGVIDNIEWALDGSAHLNGWAINCFSLTVPDNIVVTDRKGNVITSTKCTILRKDIADAYKSENLFNAGWSASIPKDLFNIKEAEDIIVYAHFLKENTAYSLRIIQPVIDLDAKKVEEDLWIKAAGILPMDKTKPYWSCNQIEGGLIFSADHILHLCCHLNINTAPANLTVEVNTIGHTDPTRFSLKDLLEKKMLITMQNQGDRYLRCKGCALLRKKMWPYRKNLFNYLNVGHAVLCNLSCKFCGIDKYFYKGVSTPTEEVVNYINLLISQKYMDSSAVISITGGEPSIMKDLDALLDLFINGKFNVFIYSNGTVFSEPIAKALKSGMAEVVISVDAVSQDAYNKIKGKDLCNTVWDNIKRYASIDNTKVKPKMIIMDENIEDVEPFVNRCKDYGIVNALYDYDRNVWPTEKITQALRFFEHCCKKNGIFSDPTYPQ